MELTGIGGLIILVADIYAIVMILQSRAKPVEKLIWSLVIFFLPYRTIRNGMECQSFLSLKQ